MNRYGEKIFTRATKIVLSKNNMDFILMAPLICQAPAFSIYVLHTFICKHCIFGLNASKMCIWKFFRVEGHEIYISYQGAALTWNIRKTAAVLSVLPKKSFWLRRL